MSCFQTWVKPSIFDFIPHWNDEDKKMMASMCFVVFNQYKTLEYDEKLSIALEIIWRRYKKIGAKLMPDNRLSGSIKKIISRTIKNKIREVEHLSNSMLGNIYYENNDTTEQFITYLSVEKIIAKALKQELDLLDENEKCSLITCFEFTNTSNGALKQKELRKRKKIRESCYEVLGA